MRKILFSGASIISVACMLAACGQSDNTTTTSSVQSSQSSQTSLPVQTQTAVPQPQVNGVVQPDGSVNYDQPDDRNVTVNAPFSSTNVDRDTGSIHVDAPFVHIEKAGRGQKMHIDIGGDDSR